MTRNRKTTPILSAAVALLLAALASCVKLRGFIGVPTTLLAVAIVAAGALFAHLRWRDSQAASSVTASCERSGLLSAADLRAGTARCMSARLSAAGYSIRIESRLDIPAKVMFNTYFEEKGVPFRLP